jgi:hypothetical protein
MAYANGAWFLELLRVQVHQQVRGRRNHEKSSACGSGKSSFF